MTFFPSCIKILTRKLPPRSVNARYVGLFIRRLKYEMISNESVVFVFFKSSLVHPIQFQNIKINGPQDSKTALHFGTSMYSPCHIIRYRRRKHSMSD